MPEREEYRKAQRQGLREYRASLAAGVYPYPQVLEELLPQAEGLSRESLGVVDIPLDLIQGTRFPGRKNAFSRSFLPLLGEDTEFAAKWSALCQAHLQEGIRDPIQAVEYLGRFYVVEGNKRVSVLRYFGAVSVSGQVTRLLPAPGQSLENQVYGEYLDFYRDTGINYVVVTRPGSYGRIIQALGQTPGTPWPRELLLDFHAAYARFWQVCRQLSLEGVEVGDALVTYLRLYPYGELETLSTQALSRRLERLRPELMAAGQAPEQAVAMELEPQADSSPLAARLLERLTLNKQRVAFLYQGEPGTSAWTAAHEFGRCQAGETLGDRVETFAFPNVEPGENAQVMLNKALALGCSVIFTTTPLLMEDSLKAAVEHPQVKFLNCSLNMPYPSVKTYYARGYEAKFLLGAIAGAMSPDGRVGYVAQCPLYGVLAEVNAFALGAAMVNQQARVFLRWNCLAEGQDPEQWFQAQGISLICHRDLRSPAAPANQFGLYQLEGDRRRNLAAPFWHWGQYYQRLLELVLGQLWPHTREGQAVNYWWGMASGVVDLLTSRSLPAPVARLVGLLKESLVAGTLDPFALPLTDQEGRLRHGGGPLSPENLVHMDWLLDRVEGRLPAREELAEQALPMVELQGILPPKETGRCEV